MKSHCIGIDLGGTKIEGVVLALDSQILWRERVPTPQGDYEKTVQAIVGLVTQAEATLGLSALPVGVGIPGTISSKTGLVKNANSVCLIGKPLDQDLSMALRRPVRLANDANCFSLSEAVDGAAAGAGSVFGVILGTGVGGGLVFNGRIQAGVNGIGGEWGHNGLPWPQVSEIPGPICYCGLQGCIETFLSGPGLARDHLTSSGETLSTREIVEGYRQGQALCVATMERYFDRVARGLASIINVVDPEVIVLGGGLSNIAEIYTEIPRRWDQWIFSDTVETRLVPAKFGDSSGVRGAAWLNR